MNRMIFIGGVHRSGTSQLHSLLRDHPDVCGLRDTGKPMDEGQHCQSVYPTDEVFGGPGRFAFDSQAAMTEDHPLATQESTTRIWDAWQNYILEQKSRFVEKSPPNIIRTRFLQQLFPSCHQVIILRHPIIVALATVKQWPTAWNGNWIPYVENALLAYERLFADRSNVTRLMILRYEDLILQESAVTKSMWDFLELPARPSNVFQNERDLPYRVAWYDSLKRLPHGGSGLTEYLDSIWMERFKRFGYHSSKPELLSPLDLLA